MDIIVCVKLHRFWKDGFGGVLVNSYTVTICGLSVQGNL